MTLPPEKSRRKAEIVRLFLTGAPADVMLDTLSDGLSDSPRAAVSEIRGVLEHFERIAFFQKMAERKALWHAAVMRQMRRSDPRRGIDELGGSPDPSTFFPAYYFANRPAIFRKILGAWPLRPAWTFDWLKANYGETGCDVMRRTGETAAPERISFGELLGSAQTTPDGDLFMVAENRALQSSLRPLLDTVPPLPGVLTDAAGGSFLWVGSAGTVTQLHHDAANVLNVQVLGSKRFVLAPPSETCFLYNHRGSYSEVDVRRPDSQRHPLFAHAERYEFTLEPGDAVFIPVGWWHFVQAQTAVVSLSFTNFPYANGFAHQERALETTHAS